MTRSIIHGRRAASAALRVFRRSTAALVATVLVLSASGLAAQSPTRLEPLSGSSVTLRGRTTVGAWRCSIGGAWALVDVSAADPLSDLVVRLPVARVRCGSRGMERDLRAALRSERHPDIVVRDVRATSVSDGVLRVEAIVEVAGVARAVSSTVRADATDPDRMRVAGSLALRMTDFDVQPPIAMLGLVRAHDDVVVEYDVRVALPATLGVVAARAALVRKTP